MTLAEFRDLLDGYGADWSQWPAAEMAAAQALLRDDAAAREAFARAELLDGLLLRALGAGQASSELRSRVARIPREHLQARPHAGWLNALLHPWRIGVAAATVSAFIGLAVGLSTAPTVDGGLDLPSLVYGMDEDDLS